MIAVVLIAVVFVFRWYIRAHLRVKHDFQIIQLGLSQITDEHLYEKYPILIQDEIIDASTLLVSLFKYQYVFKEDITLDTNTRPIKNTHKFMVLHNRSDNDAAVSILPPTNHEQEGDPIKLKTTVPSYNVLILPFKWHIANGDVSLHGYVLNDVIHRMFPFT